MKTGFCFFVIDKENKRIKVNALINKSFKNFYILKNFNKYLNGSWLKLSDFLNLFFLETDKDKIQKTIDQFENSNYYKEFEIATIINIKNKYKKMHQEFLIRIIGEDQKNIQFSIQWKLVNKKNKNSSKQVIHNLTKEEYPNLTKWKNNDIIILPFQKKMPDFLINQINNSLLLFKFNISAYIFPLEYGLAIVTKSKKITYKILDYLNINRNQYFIVNDKFKNFDIFEKTISEYLFNYVLKIFQKYQMNNIINFQGKSMSELIEFVIKNFILINKYDLFSIENKKTMKKLYIFENNNDNNWKFLKNFRYELLDKSIEETINSISHSDYNIFLSSCDFKSKNMIDNNIGCNIENIKDDISDINSIYIDKLLTAQEISQIFKIKPKYLIFRNKKDSLDFENQINIKGLSNLQNSTILIRY